MAYSFNRLASSLGEDEGKNNIFGQDSQQGGMGLTGGGSSGGQKFGSTGGEAAGAGGPKVSDSGEGSAEPTMSLTSGASQSQMANLNEPSSEAQSNVYSNVGQAISQKKQDLSDEARDYTANTEKATSGSFYGDEKQVGGEVQSALDSGGVGYGNLQTFLNGGSAPQVADYTSNVATGDINIPRSQSELAGHLQRTSSRPTYSGGQANLDAALLRRSQPFQQEQQQLQTAAEGLAGQQERQTLDAETQQANAQTEYEAQQDMIRDILRNSQQDLLMGQGGDMDAARADPTEQQLREAFDTAQTGYEGEYSGQYGYNQPGYDLDTADYYTPGAVSDDPFSYFDQGERSRYDQIAGLLGTENAGAGDPRGAGAFDVGRYFGDIAGIQSGRDAEIAALEGGEHLDEIDPRTMANVSGEDTQAGQLQIRPDAQSSGENYAGIRPLIYGRTDNQIMDGASMPGQPTAGSLAIDPNAAANPGEITRFQGNPSQDVDEIGTLRNIVSPWGTRGAAGR